jgi:esterase
MKLFFRKEGSGNPLVILHGLHGSSDNWTGIARKLASRFTVYCIDQRNHGRSFHSSEHTYQAMKTDLAGFIEEHIQNQVVLLGHSMGGKVAMLFAADYPEKVKQLFVADIAPKNYMKEDENQFFLHRNIFLAMMEMNLSGLQNRKEVEDQLSEKINDHRTVQFLLKNVTADPVSHHLTWRLNVHALYENLEEIVEGVNFQWFDNRIPITAYPVVFIRGLQSPYIKDSDIQDILRIYPDAILKDIPDAGHWLHAEQPELFLKAVLESVI